MQLKINTIFCYEQNQYFKHYDIIHKSYIPDYLSSPNDLLSFLHLLEWNVS